jgi:hypothetical protein
MCHPVVVKIDDINIDKGNREKLQKHGVSLEEIIEFFSAEFYVLRDEGHSEKESRFIGFSEVRGRSIFVAFTIRTKNGKLVFRPISARFAHKREVEKLYEKINRE